MPAVDTVLLPLCVGLTLLGIIATGLAWRRGNKGRVLRGVALALAPIALYFSGLLRLIWNGAVAVGSWASRVIPSPSVWFGLGLLAVCVVLWVVGGVVARRYPGRSRSKGAPAVQQSRDASSRQAVAPAKAVTPAKSGAPTKTGAPAQASAPVDDDMAEIEALLKSRGIN